MVISNNSDLQFQPFFSPRGARNIAAGRTALALSDSHLLSLQAEGRAHQQLYDLDSQLRRVLLQMGSQYGVEDLPQILYGNDAGILAFDDSWTLYAWSLWWIQRHGSDPSLEVVVLHADDHQDLVSPLLAKVPAWFGPEDCAWTDVLTGKSVSLDDPESIASAILSGAIGIGTFMAPFIHCMRRVEIRHLHQSGGSVCYLLQSTQPDARLLPIAERLAIEKKPCDKTYLKGTSIYRSTSNAHEWVRNIPENAKVLLHIDLDYFNDFYGGGRSSNRLEPDEAEMERSIESLCEALESSGVYKRVENTALALSPGFCPSRHWEFLIRRLRQYLRGSGCCCP